MNEKKTDALLRNIEGLPSDIIENVSYEDGMKIAEQYKWYERKIAEQQKLLDKIFLLSRDSRDERIYNLFTKKENE